MNRDLPYEPEPTDARSRRSSPRRSPPKRPSRAREAAPALVGDRVVARADARARRKRRRPSSGRSRSSTAWRSPPGSGLLLGVVGTAVGRPEGLRWRGSRGIYQSLTRGDAAARRDRPHQPLGHAADDRDAHFGAGRVGRRLRHLRRRIVVSARQICNRRTDAHTPADCPAFLQLQHAQTRSRIPDRARHPACDNAPHKEATCSGFLQSSWVGSASATSRCVASARRSRRARKAGLERRVDGPAYLLLDHRVRDDLRRGARPSASRS